MDCYFLSYIIDRNKINNIITGYKNIMLINESKLLFYHATFLTN